MPGGRCGGSRREDGIPSALAGVHRWAGVAVVAAAVCHAGELAEDYPGDHPESVRPSPWRLRGAELRRGAGRAAARAGQQYAGRPSSHGPGCAAGVGGRVLPGAFALPALPGGLLRGHDRHISAVPDRTDPADATAGGPAADQHAARPDRAYLLLNTPMAALITATFFQTVPAEMQEAAALD